MSRTPVGTDAPPTAPQLRLYRLLLKSLLRLQRFPTYREMCRALDYHSTNSVTAILLGLERRGLVRKVGRTFVLPGVCLEPAFADSGAGRRARLAWEGDLSAPTGEGGAA